MGTPVLLPLRSLGLRRGVGAALPPGGTLLFVVWKYYAPVIPPHTVVGWAMLPVDGVREASASEYLCAMSMWLI